jgi:hypothetical protein
MWYIVFNIQLYSLVICGVVFNLVNEKFITDYAELFEYEGVP